MNICEICQKSFKRKLTIPSCCQVKSESKYQLCGRCIRKCKKCPFCRSLKKEDILKRSLIYEIEYMIRLHAIFRIACETIATEIGNMLYRHPFVDPDTTTLYYNCFRNDCIGIITENNQQLSDIVGIDTHLNYTPL